MARERTHVYRYEMRLEAVGRVCEASGPIVTPIDTIPVIRALCGDRAQEHFVVLALDARNQVTATSVVSVGTLTSNLVHPREVFRFAIATPCAAIIVAHNHPSGDTTPSQEDIAITKRLKDAGELMGIEVLDHIIVGGDDFISMKKGGLM